MSVGRFQAPRRRSILVGTTRCVAGAYTVVPGGIDTAHIYLSWILGSMR